MLLRRLLWLALGIALIAGTLQWLVQQWQAVPIIMAAEQFEGRKAEVAAPAAHGHDHGHEHEAWVPQDGFERQAWTWIANVLLAFGLALLVLSVLGLWVRQRGASMHPLRAGLLVGCAGFCALYLWPVLGLPPEIPGMDSARLGSRQGWWLLAAGCAVAAFAIAAWGRRPWRWLVATALLALPFFIGAPLVEGDPFGVFGPEAAEQLRTLTSRFGWATAFAAAVQWLALGLLCGLAFERWLLLPLLGGDARRPTVRATIAPGLHR